MQFERSRLAAAVPRSTTVSRQPGSLENSQPWVLAVTCGAAAGRVRSWHAPPQLARLRRLALKALKRETSSQRRLKQQSQQAALHETDRLTGLAAALPAADSKLEPSCQ